MEYKGYEAHIEYDEEGRLLHGEVSGLRDVITFQAYRMEDLEKEFHQSVDVYLEYCCMIGKTPDIKTCNL